MTVAIVIFKVLRLKSAAVWIAALAANVVDVLPAVAEPEWLAQVLVSEVTQPPPGWVEFCARQPSECVGRATTPRDVALSREAWRELVLVNKWVNETIKPLTDLEHWDVVERWSYPDDGYGDCEDYVLLKRRMLIRSGWPREALLVTVVSGEKDEGHAVLTVTTDKGDYVLDNQNKDILLWSKTSYRFVKRQSQSNPGVWVSLGDPRPAIATAASSASRFLPRAHQQTRRRAGDICQTASKERGPANHRRCRTPEYSAHAQTMEKRGVRPLKDNH